MTDYARGFAEARTLEKWMDLILEYSDHGECDTIYIPFFSAGLEQDQDHFLKCVMEWEKEDLKKIIPTVNEIVRCLRKILSICKALPDGEAEKKIHEDARLEKFYKKYLTEARVEKAMITLKEDSAFDPMSRLVLAVRKMVQDMAGGKTVIDKRPVLVWVLLTALAQSVQDGGNSLIKMPEIKEFLSENDIDAFYRPQKMNSTKNIVSVFIYLFLKNHSDAEHPRTQKEILNYLKEEEGILLERKALSRIIHSLANQGLGIRSDRRKGAWYDEYETERR